ncbi:MAG: DHH family phosphoesterase [bacterium]
MDKREFNRLAEEIRQLLDAASNVLLVSHDNCGDAVGSLLAFESVIEGMDKKAVMHIPSPVLRSYRYLSGWDRIIVDKEKIDLSQFDLIVCLDLGALVKSGMAERLQPVIDQRLVTVVNIDHHFTNDDYGHVNLVDRTASANTEVLYDLLKVWNIPITQDIGLCLYNGLVSDTGNFTNNGVTAKALSLAAALSSQGISHQQVVRESFQGTSDLEKLKLWGRILSKLFVDQEQGLLVAVATLEEAGEGKERIREDLDSLSNFLSFHLDYDSMYLKGVLVLKDLGNGFVKGSLRTVKDDVDVSAIAKLFPNGGGHKKAAGFMAPGRLTVAKNNEWSIVSV